jgi:hypothetical protein
VSYFETAQRGITIALWRSLSGQNKEKKMGIGLKLISSEHGFDDFDVTNMPQVHRACVGHGIKKGDLFNVYCDNGVKLGATWRGDVEGSLVNFAATHSGYRQLCGAAETA